MAGLEKRLGVCFQARRCFRIVIQQWGGWDDCVCIQFSGTDSCPSDRSRTGTDCSEDRIPCIGGRGQSFGLFSEKVRSRDFRWRRIYYAETVRKWNGFSEFDGHVVQYDLQPGQQIVVDTGYLAAMEGSCSMEVQTVPGLKNMVFGGEGVFNTVVTGPGRVWLQTMPISNVAGEILKFMPSGK